MPMNTGTSLALTRIYVRAPTASATAFHDHPLHAAFHLVDIHLTAHQSTPERQTTGVAA